MRKYQVLALAIFAAQGCSLGPIAEIDADLWIRDVAVISVGHDGQAGTRDVLIQDGRIVFIGKLTAHRVSATTTVIDGTHRFLIPGLIDSHTHLSEIPGLIGENEPSVAAIASEARAQIPRSYLYHGFTTVIDLNSRPQAIDDWNSQPVRPQAYFCGGSPVFDGYPMSFMPKPARYQMMPYFLYDESRSAEFPEGIDPRHHTPSAVVERIYDDGGICVKTHYERGFGERRDLPIPSGDLVRALADSAHARGMPVLLHANSEAAQSFAIATGIDAFAHGMWTWNDRSVTAMHTDIERIVDATIEHGISLQPTIQVLYGERDIHDPEYLDDPRLTHVLPASLLAWYRTETGQWWRQQMLQIPFVAQLVKEGHWDELDAEPIARVYNVLRYFTNHGGSLLFGSDTPSSPTFANPPGLNGRIEMDRWIAAGVSPLQLFTAATISNARFFGIENEIGTIETGKRADLLLLGDNPLVSVAAYDTIEYVILGGKVFDRSDLSADSGKP